MFSVKHLHSLYLLISPSHCVTLEHIRCIFEPRQRVCESSWNTIEHDILPECWSVPGRSDQMETTEYHRSTRILAET